MYSEYSAISAPTTPITATTWNGRRLPDVTSFALQKRQLLTIRKLENAIRHPHTNAIHGLSIGDPL